MINFVLKKLESDTFYLVCMNYLSILNYLDEIEHIYDININKGELIIDQLLVAGNGKNRFISCQFSYGKIDLGSAKNIEGIYEYQKRTSELLRQNADWLSFSILTENQMLKIREGHVI